jgi:thiamine-phosphate pyrophosphorylase
VRLRHRSRSVPGEASPAAGLSRRLEAARLYFVTPDRAPEAVLAIAAAAIRGGVDVIQLRHKTLPRGQLLELARRLQRLAVKNDRLFFVNDHVDVALLAGADGVHLGPEDLNVESARKVAGERLLIGASASSVEAAEEAVREGADYLGSGPAFATPIKAEKKVIGPAGIAAIGKAVAVPVFAIGGIDASNVHQLIAAGVRRACVIRAIGAAPDAEQAARTLRAMLDA